MKNDLERMVHELNDKQKIREQIYNYCRAVDRMDRELLISVYHPDAIDDHGMFVGGPEDFADWAFSYHTKHQYAHQHIVTNHTCDLEGDTAHTETYWMFAGMNRQGAPLNLGGGRYIDRFEKRDGKWKIAARKCVPDWGGASGESSLSPEEAKAFAGSGVVARNRTDSSYERPLTITIERKGFVFKES